MAPMKKEVVTRLHKQFEDYVHVQNGVEFWYARELQNLLGYTKWDNFLEIVLKAQIACKANGYAVSDHFADVGKMVDLGSGSQRTISDIKLTRYACYLIAQNGDPRKQEIAFAMNYFAVQTRRQELIQERIAQWERIRAREKLTMSEKELSRLIFERGIDERGFARVRSQGDAALFGGITTQRMKKRLNVPASRALADFLPAVTIKAKDFATEVTNIQIQQQGLDTEKDITKENVKNNKDVRKILTNRNIFPEKLPASEDVRKVDRRLKAEQKKVEGSSKKLKLLGK